MLVRKALLESVITLSVLAFSSIASIADERSASTDHERLEARRVAESVVESYVNAYDAHDPKAISMLFVPDGVFLPPNGSPVVQGREAIERSWAELFKNVGGHVTITVKDAIPAGKDAVVAITEFKIVGDGQNSGKTISGRASIALAKTPDGWRYVSIAPQTQPPPSGATTVSAVAQQPPPDVKQKLDSLIAKVRDAYVKNDAAAYARAFTSDGILVAGTGKVLRGQQEIEQATKTTISSLGGTKDLQVEIDELHALPDGTVWYIGHATITGNQKEIKDHFTVVAVAEGNGYALKMLNIGLDVPSPR